MKKIIDFIKKHDMLPEGTRVLCAVSGGADSMCLLHFLSTNAEKLKINVAAAHFNHKLRGDEADRDEQFVKAWCEENGIEFKSGSADVKAYAEQNGMGTEEAARTLRYEFLNNCADSLNCTAIATAHNCDDNAETLLLNLVRGSGAKGLCAIPPIRGKIIRPLLSVTRAEIEQYLEQNNVPHVEDSTNAEDDYTRNILRHKVMPVLRSINPAFSEAAMRTSCILRTDEEYLEGEAKKFVELNLNDSSLPANELSQLPKPVGERVLRLICGRALTAGQTEAVMELLSSEELAHTDIHGMRITHDSGRLYFGKESKKLPDTEIAVNGTTVIADCGMTVEARLMPYDDKVFKLFNTFCFNYESICGTILLTSRRDGDKVMLEGRKCTKKLKDLFSEAKMPQHERDLTPVLRDEKGIIAVGKFGTAQRCAVKKDKSLLCVTINKDFTGENY